MAKDSFENVVPLGERKRLLSAAREMYWHEVSKPETERDTGLMEECLLTIRYLSSAPEKKRADARERVGLRRIALVFMSILLVIALSTGIAYAAGVDVWSIIFTRGNGSVNIEGRTETSVPSATPFNNVEDTEGYVEFATIDTALQELGFNPLILDLTNMGLMEHNILGARSGANISLVVDYYSADNSQYVYYSVDAYPQADGQTAFDKTIAAGGTEATTFTVGDITHYIIASPDGESVIIWFFANTLYQISSNLDADTLIATVTSLYD